MDKFSMSHLPREVLLHDVSVENSQDCERIAIRLAQLAEIDAQEYYRPLGYDTMFRYCVGELHFSEDSAWKRIQAAKICRRFPVLFEAVADGRLHLSAVCMLAPRLEPGNVDELLAAATHRSKSQIEQLLAERFPKPDVPTHIRALPQPAPTLDIHPAPGQEIELATGMIPAHAALASAPAPGQKLPPTRRAKVAPLAAERYALHVTFHGRRGRSYAAFRTCSVIRYLQETWRRPWTGHSTRCSRSSRNESSQRRRGRACAGARRIRATSQPTFAAPSTRETVANARSSAIQAGGVTHGAFSNTTTCWKSRAEGGRPSKAFDCAAAPTISTRPSRRSESNSCGAGAARPLMLAPRPGKPVRDVTKRGRLVLASRPRAKQRTATVSRQTA